jgi:general secretion pathway protein K
MTMRTTRHRPAQRGMALLLAMVILTLVATLAAGMVWQQSRAVQIEAADRASSQAGWILTGALDWARLILREDQRNGGADHLGEPWATPLAEARLSTFLAADQNNNADSGPEAFLSGAIEDAQARYNLNNVLDGDGKVQPVELAALQRLCNAAGVPTDTAGRIADGLRQARAGATDGNDAPLAVPDVGQLTWLGLDAATVARLEPFLVLLPQATPVNLNTAPREVLVAAIDQLDLATAERLVQQRQRDPFDKLEDVEAQLPQNMKPDPKRAGVSSSHFYVYGRLRLEDRVLQERSLIERRGGGGSGSDVVVLRRERQHLQPGGGQ